MTQNDRFLIVGLGLMGGGYAMGLTRQGYTVTAIDSDPAAIAYATRHGLLAQGALAGTPAADTLLAAADAVVLALYPADIVPWLKTNLSSLKPGALLTDLAGVKGCYVYEAQALTGTQHEYIACHPMAGRETSGVQHADDGMFAKANFIITPTEQNTPAGIAFARTLAETLGFARITQLSVPQHDALIGYVSQLTHTIAVALMNANDDPLLPLVTGDSFRDLTRIADINETLWSELFLANAPALTAEMDAFAAQMGKLRACIEAGDREGLMALLRESGARRRAFGKQ